MERFLQQRERLIDESPAGLESARALAHLTDEALRTLAANSAKRPARRWALVALGGYGAGALLPASDIDLLIVTDESASRLKPFVESVLYPLWDSGLKVGHQVRSERDQLRACKEDLQTLTAALTARAIAGDLAFGDDVVLGCVKAASKRAKTVLVELSARARPGSPFLLEPDLKDGCGGRRDFDELVWRAAVLSGSRTADPELLVSVGLLTPDELAAVRRAAEKVASVRWSLQRAGRRDSQLTNDLAHDSGGDDALHRALADTARALDAVRANPHGEQHHPRVPLDGTEILSLIDSGAASIGQLEQSACLGDLDAYISGFSELMYLRRPGLSHRYTVGAHSLRAATSVAAICREARGALSRSCDQLADRPALAIAALAHDVGKRAGGPDHPRLGAEPAHEAALRFGLRPSRAQDVADLVRLHLVLVETAARHDIDDEDAVLRTACQIGRRELVAPLHVLSVADSLATGPEAWGPWQETRVGALVARLDAALSPEVDGAGMAIHGEAVRAEALIAAGDNPPVLRFLRAAPLRYLSSNTAEQALAHARLVSAFDPQIEPLGFRVGVNPASSLGAWAVAVAAADRPELFARIAGALTLSGLDILGADASCTHEGVALDVFTVRSATLAVVSSDVWARFERYLGAALANRLELEVRLAERRRHYPASAVDITPAVEVDPSSGYGTLIRVRAGDRAGLLYDIAHGISSEGFDIRWATAITSNGAATDSFLVVGPDGTAPTNPGDLGHLAMRVREAIERS
jgi:[protein-PII] uridylyltransferase